jgi:hypothetical protein
MKAYGGVDVTRDRFKSKLISRVWFGPPRWFRDVAGISTHNPKEDI